MPKNPRLTKTIPWRMAYISYEILSACKFVNNSELLGKFPHYLILRISGTALQGPCISTSTATPTPMVDESMADEFKVEESTADNTIPWRIAYV